MLEWLDALGGLLSLGGVFIGVVLVLVGAVMFLAAAFRESLGWGLACLLVPFAAAVFLALHWQEARRPFYLQAAGVALFFLAGAFLPDLGLPSG